MIFRNNNWALIIVSSFFLLAATLAGCTFEPHENFVKVDKTPKVSLTDTKLQSRDLLAIKDTFSIYARTTLLSYSLQLVNAATLDVKVYLDGGLVHESNAVSDSFSIYAPNYKDGLHSLRMEVVTNSGTGSLADNIGTEQLQWKREWTFSINRVQPPPLKITKVYPQNGRLIIEWEASQTITEKIIEFEYLYPYTGSVKWSYVIQNPIQTQLIDSLYVEGQVNVTLTNQSIDPIINSPQDQVSVQYNFPAIAGYSTDANGHVTLRWPKSLFYKNVKGYTLDYPDPVSQQSNIIARTASGTDSSLVTDKIPFGWQQSVIFRTVAKYLKSSDTVRLRTVSSINEGEGISTSFTDVVHAPLQPDLGFSSDNYKYAFNVLSGDSAVLSVPTGLPTTYTSRIYGTTMATSNHGEYLYYAFNSKITRMDRSGNMQTILDTQLAYGKKMVIANIAIGGDQYLSFDDRSTLNIHNYTFDIIANTAVFDVVDPNLNYNLPNYIQPSPNGQYLVLTNPPVVTVYGLSNGQYQAMKTFQSYDILGAFYTSDGKLMLCGKTGIFGYDPATDVSSAPIKMSPLPQGSVCYDPITGKVGFGLSGYYYVADLGTGEILRKILMATGTGNPWFLYNGYLYNGNRKLNLQLK